MVKEPGPFTGFIMKRNLLENTFLALQADLQIANLLKKIMFKAEERKKTKSIYWRTLIKSQYNEVNSHNFIVNSKPGHVI